MGNSTVSAAEREWEERAHFDPLWAILVDKERQFGKWDREEFFASGQREVDALMTSCGFSAGNNGRALDFGCGVGRLSRALNVYFGEVYGVDISQEMIRLAKEFTPSCTFLVNRTDHLKVFEADFFDFIYSNIVLQHQPTRKIAKAYIREFVRVIKPGALVVFQMPYKRTLRHALRPRCRLYSLLRACGIPGDFLYNKLGLAPMRAIALPCQEVAETVAAAGGRILRSYRDVFNHYSMSYVVAKG
jgi:2-polyprenyl-3-methyl-5-hydroxy-6-metoxy-1,4-benzoquinol methylase